MKIFKNPLIALAYARAICLHRNEQPILGTQKTWRNVRNIIRELFQGGAKTFPLFPLQQERESLNHGDLCRSYE